MGHVARLGIVTGLPQEAALLRRIFGTDAPPVFCAGTDPARVPAGIAGLVGRGSTLLVSFGFAGGLVPSLAAGDIILADRVVASDGLSKTTDPAARSRVGAALAELHCRWRGGIVAGTDQVVDTPLAKRRLATESGALAADMESHVLAAVAGRVPFIVLRVVIDPAHRAVPSAALGALAPDGRVRPARLVLDLLRAPSQVAPILALARDNTRARPALGRAAAALRRAFGPEAL